MHAVGWAFAWEMWRGSRLVLVPTLAYLLALVLLVQAFPAGTFAPERIAELTIPLWLAGLNLFALLSHAESADLVARESGYPRRTLTRPLRTVTLAGWPMALGGTAVALLWLAVVGLVLRPAGLPVPLLWPAVFLAALLAWGQALMWFPFPLPFLRLLVAVPILGGLTTGAMLAQSYDWSPALLLSVSAGLIPLGYLMAVVGLERARRGDTPVWSWRIFARRAPAAAGPAPFASAADALSWLDWRRHGWGLPILVALVLVPELALLMLDVRARQPGLVAGVFLGTLVSVPPFMGAGAGAFLGNGHPWSRKVAGLPAFSAARPVTSAAMIAVKLRVAFRATLLTWALAYLVILALLPWCPEGEVLVHWARQLIDRHGGQGAVLLVLILLGLPALTMKELISQLWIGLTGRRWVGLVLALTCPAGLVALSFLIDWIALDGEAQEARLAVLPRVLALALPLKLAAGLVIGRAVLRRRLVPPRTVLRFAIAWLAAAAVIFGLTFWLMPADVCSPFIVGCAAVVLGLPLVRLGLAPLALDWNRHR
jgi:hypothetical protein